MSFQSRDREFSLGLTYYEIMELSELQLDLFLEHTSREEAIDWLQWNDPNGIYIDKISLDQDEPILSKSEAVAIIKRQIRES